MRRPLLLLLPLTLTGGCSSIASALLGRPVQADHYKDGEQSLSVMALQGQYRVGVIRDVRSTLRACAESLPDTAVAAGASSGVTVSDPTAAGARSLAANDEYQTALLQTFHRTETADVVRQLGWQYCQAWSNGALRDAQYAALLEQLTRGAVAVLEKRASGAPAAPSGTVQVNLRGREAAAAK